MILLEWTAADVASAMDALTRAGVRIYGAVDVDGVTFRFGIRRGDHRRVLEICEKRGDQMKIVRRTGWYWRITGLKKRPVLVMGALILLFLVLTIPSRVFFIRVEGNRWLPANRILEAAGESGICFGASRRDVRSEQMKNRLLGELPELQWAGVNTYGCVAVITVREKPAEEPEEVRAGVSSIVASTDGVILSATATEGNLLCVPGQAVSKGQVLISPYTDCGICIRVTGAEGEIMAQTRHNSTTVTPVIAVKRGAVRQVSVNFSLLIGKKRINLWKDSGISDGSCGRMYEEYYITLPGGFCLPVALVKETVTSYDPAVAEKDPDDVLALLTEQAVSRLKGQMVAGQILDTQVDFCRDGDRFVLKGYYLCTEMIGRVRKEQIGDTNGKSD